LSGFYLRASLFPLSVDVVCADALDSRSTKVACARCHRSGTEVGSRARM
jgi:hypothetical protein